MRLKSFESPEVHLCEPPAKVRKGLYKVDVEASLDS